jgi:hypothetical protein
MSIERVPKVLSQDNKKLLLSKLEETGARNIVEDLRRSLLEGLDSSLLNDKEFMLRYLLLTAVLDQQAESESAKRTVRSIIQKYGYKFFMSPREYFDNIRDVIQLALGTYEPRVRVLRMKKEGITLLRIGGFMLAVNSLSLRFGGLFNYFKQYRTPYELLNRGILREPLLSGLLYEKAARLYVGWITHPQLVIRIYGESVPRNTIPMVVNGHIARVESESSLGVWYGVYVWLQDGKIVASHCTCIGYAFRKHCKHVEWVRNEASRRAGRGSSSLQEPPQR